MEPSVNPAVKPFKSALVADGIPFVSFQVDDLDSGYKRLCESGLKSKQSPMEAGDVKMAVLDDTCGNLIKLIQMLKTDS